MRSGIARPATARVRTNLRLAISTGFTDSHGIYSAWDTGINAWVTVSPYAPNERVTVTVTSNGWQNRIVVGACSPANTSCPSRDLE